MRLVIQFIKKMILSLLDRAEVEFAPQLMIAREERHTVHRLDGLLEYYALQHKVKEWEARQSCQTSSHMTLQEWRENNRRVNDYFGRERA